MVSPPSPLACIVCRTPLENQDIHRPLDVARCPKCQTILELRHPGGLPVRKDLRQRVQRPASVLAIDRQDRLEVKLGADRWRASALLFCAAIELGSAIALLAIFGMDVRVTVLALVMATIGVVLARAGMNVLDGRQRLTAKGRSLRARDAGPLFLGDRRRARDVDVGRLKQLFVTEHCRATPIGALFTYALQAQLKDGTVTTLLASLPTADEALFLEQEFERRLDLVDAPVPGEVARRSGG